MQNNHSDSSKLFYNTWIFLNIIATATTFVTANVYADNFFAGRNVTAHPNTLNNFNLYNPDNLWPEAAWPNNVWWVPLEFAPDQNDVVQAIITPVSAPDDWRGYNISIGTARQNISAKELNFAKAVGRLSYTPSQGMQWLCTATHVGNGYVVTAGHCVANPKFVQDACRSLKVEWDTRKPRKDFPAVLKAETIVGQCQEILSWEFTAGDAKTIDHAIFRVDHAPDAKIAIESKPDLKSGDLVHQFSHPGGAPLIWTDRCKITALPIQYYQHDCWGASGSSGAALIDVAKGTLIGVLSMGSDSIFFSLRNDVSPIGCLDIEKGEINLSC